MPPRSVRASTPRALSRSAAIAATLPAPHTVTTGPAGSWRSASGPRLPALTALYASTWMLPGIDQSRSAAVRMSTTVTGFPAARVPADPRSRCCQPASASGQLLARLKAGEPLMVIDVRPSEEFRAGHIAGAVSMPLAELEERLRELPAGREAVAYCRGPYCAFAPEAVRTMRDHGSATRHLGDAP